MIGRRNFISGTVKSLAVSIMPFEHVLAECSQDAPYIKDTYGIENRCAKYARLVAEKKFNKNFQPGPAWTFSKRNKSIKKISDEHWNERHYNKWWIDYFNEKGILLPGMILGTFYRKSHWNNKFYTPQDGHVWTKYKNMWRRFRGDGIHKNEILPKEKINELEKIPYTHLIINTGIKCKKDYLLFHQFPYGNKILQKVILPRDLEKNYLFPKEIIAPKIV